MADDGTDERDIYAAVRRGVRDGIWDVVERATALFLAVVLFVVGGAFAASGLQGTTTWLPVAFGVVLMALAAAYALDGFDYLPF